MYVYCIYTLQCLHADNNINVMQGVFLKYIFFNFMKMPPPSKEKKR